MRDYYVEDDVNKSAAIGTAVGRLNASQKDFLETGCSGTSIFLPAAVIGAGTPNFFNVIKIDTEDRRSVPLSITLTTAATGVTSQNLVARVRWGVAGTFAELVADFVKGFVFNLCSSSLQVDVANLNAVTINAGAFVSKGANGVSASPRFTNPLGFMAPLGSVIITVPDFGSLFQVLRDQSQGAITIRYFDAGGALLVLETIAVGTRHLPIALPRDCETIQVTNDSAVNALANARGIFTLAI